MCRALNQKCMCCGKLGHFARMCRSKIILKEKEMGAKPKQPKPLKKKERDMNRLEKYMQTKYLMRELPFANIRDGSFRSTLKLDSVIRQELQNVRKKYKEQQIEN